METGQGMITVLFIVALVASSSIGKTISSNQNSVFLKDSKQDGENESRVIRSLGRSAAALILKSAKLIFANEKSRMFQKPGGFNAALDDFKLFKPTRVQGAGNVIVGVNGNKHIILNSEMVQPFIEVRYVKSDGSPMTDFIKYTN